MILRICFQFYQFTLFAMSLNEMKPGNTICPTDSRLRPDIRKLESGDIDGAALEKTRLEEKQRDARKSKKSKKGDEFVPRYEYSIACLSGMGMLVLLLHSLVCNFVPQFLGRISVVVDAFSQPNWFLVFPFAHLGDV